MDCSSEAVQLLSDEVTAPMELKKGMSIFLDILRRADKNDDGKLSFDEFRAYFHDGVLTSDQLKELFNTIDTHNTDNVDTDELCDCFVYVLYVSSNADSGCEISELDRRGPVKPDVLSIQWSGRRSNRRLQRNNSLSPNNPLLSLVNSGLYEEDNQWMTQVNRLQKLIDRLEKKEVRMEPVEEEVLEGITKSHILIVQRQLNVLEEYLDEFRLALRQYMECACAQTGCLQ
eukprot:XP_014034324.1 PREDICTED: N-terminal EF-hand calcium-binding protein 1-like [Salmo salar]